MTPTLTQDQIELFHAQGFLSLDRIVDPGELAELRVIYDDIFASRKGWDDGAMFDLGGPETGGDLVLPQIVRPSRYVPELTVFSYWRNARSVAEQLYPDLEPGAGEHMVYKPARIGAVTPWHQDQAYHSAELITRGVNIWMSLDDADVDNGCMHFVPGSHHLDVLPHHTAAGDDRIHSVEVDDAERWHAMRAAAPVPAGGCTLHANYMLHYCPPNRSDRCRRAWTISFIAPPTMRETPVDLYWLRNRNTGKRAREDAARSRKMISRAHEG